MWKKLKLPMLKMKQPCDAFNNNQMLLNFLITYPVENHTIYVNKDGVILTRFPILKALYQRGFKVEDTFNVMQATMPLKTNDEQKIATIYESHFNYKGKFNDANMA